MSATEDKPYTGALTVIAAVTVIIAITTAVTMNAVAQWGIQHEYAAKYEGRSVFELEAQRAAAHAHLASYGWVDRGAGTVHIPIEDAKRLALAELR